MALASAKASSRPVGVFVLVRPRIVTMAASLALNKVSTLAGVGRKLVLPLAKDTNTVVDTGVPRYSPD